MMWFVKVFVYMGGDQRVPQDVTHLRVHKSVKIIRRMTFWNCRRLVWIEMHDGVEIIEEDAFYKCWSLRSINLAGVMVIEDGAFFDCLALEDVEFGDKLETIGRYAFAGTSIKHIEIPNVRVIGYGAFENCQQLFDAKFSDDLKIISGHAFGDCRRLNSIAIPLKDDMFEDGDNVFNNCGNLSRVKLVGGIHKSISSLLLDSWRNEMNVEIHRINRDLPNTRTDLKTAAIQRWIERVLEKIELFKSDGDSDDGVMEDTTMDNSSFGQLEESTQSKDPKKQVAVHNDDSIISRREEDETSRRASSADGGNHSNVATASTDIYSSNFPWGQGGGQQRMGMPVHYNLMAGAGGFIPTIYQLSPFFGFCPPTIQSGFFQHSNASSGNQHQQIEPAAEIIVIDNEDDATMDNPSFDQSEESNHQDDPKKQATVHDNLMSCREEDETSRSASSVGAGSSLEDEIPESTEIEGVAVETKDDSSFRGGDQNDDFHTESDVSSEEVRQSDFAKSTEGSEEQSEIQKLKAQLKESESKNAALEARLKQNEEDKNQQRQEYERNVEFLEGDKNQQRQEHKRKFEVLEEENGRLKGENGRLKKQLKVSVQTSSDLLEAAFKEMKIEHEPEVIRQLAEEGLLECLENHKVELGRSKIEGARFGAFAMAKISAGEKIFHFNGAPSNETISLTENKIAKLPPHVQRVVRMYTQPDDDGVRDVPKNGFSFALGISWFLNTAHGTEFEANVDVGPKLDESGFAELIALRDIEPGEELLDSYVLGDTL